MFSLNYIIQNSSIEKTVLRVLPDIKSEIIYYRIKKHEIQRSIDVLHKLLHNKKVKLPDRNTSGPNKIERRLEILERDRHEARKQLRQAIQNGFKNHVINHKNADSIDVEIDLNEYRNELLNILD